jgi:hypothetical protein
MPQGDEEEGHAVTDQVFVEGREATRIFVARAACPLGNVRILLGDRDEAIARRRAVERAIAYVRQHPSTGPLERWTFAVDAYEGAPT